MAEADTATGVHSPTSDSYSTQCVRCSAPMGRDDRFCKKCGAERLEDATVVSHVSLRNAQAAIIHVCTVTPAGGKHFITQWVIHQANLKTVVMHQCDGHRELWEAM